MLSWRGNSVCRSIRLNFICAICLANSTYVTGHKQSASTSKRSAESTAAGASRAIGKKRQAIENGVDLLLWRPRACHLPIAQNMLIEACGGARLRDGAALPRPKPKGQPGGIEPTAS